MSLDAVALNGLVAIPVLFAALAGLAVRRTSDRLALGLAVRLLYLWFSRHGTCNFLLPDDRPQGCAGDSYVYHFQARLLTGSPVHGVFRYAAPFDRL